MQYKTEDLEKFPRSSDKERRHLIWKIIENNPQIRHTAIIKLALDYGNIPKKTVESALENLESEGFCHSVKWGKYSNAPRTWGTIPKNTEPQLIFEKLDSFSKQCLEYVKIIEKFYDKLDDMKKTEALAHLLSNLYFSGMLYELVDPGELDLRKPLERIDQAIEKSLEIFDNSTEKIKINLFVYSFAHLGELNLKLQQFFKENNLK